MTDTQPEDEQTRERRERAEQDAARKAAIEAEPCPHCATATPGIVCAAHVALSRPATPAQAGEAAKAEPSQIADFRRWLEESETENASLRAERDSWMVAAEASKRSASESCAEVERLAARVVELEGPQPPSLTQLERAVVDAAYTLVDAWQDSAREMRGR